MSEGRGWGRGEHGPGSDPPMPCAFVHPRGEPRSCPECPEAEEKPHLQPSSVVGPAGCSWDFWWLQRCLPLTGGAVVLALAFCSAFTAAGVVLRGPPWAVAAAPHSVGGGLTLIGVQPGQGSCASSSSSSSPGCRLPLAAVMSPLPLSVLCCTC